MSRKSEPICPRISLSKRRWRWKSLGYSNWSSLKIKKKLWRSCIRIIGIGLNSSNSTQNTLAINNSKHCQALKVLVLVNRREEDFSLSCLVDLIMCKIQLLRMTKRHQMMQSRLQSLELIRQLRRNSIHHHSHQLVLHLRSSTQSPVEPITSSKTLLP